MKIDNLIISQITKKGRINVAEFIELCQFSNDGYYINHDPIGQKNDFITSPEISQMFGEIIGAYLINFWEKNIQEEFNLVELGPGKGTLIEDIIRTAKINKDFLNSIKLFLIEKNESLIEKQKKKFSKLNIKNITWLKDFDIKDKKPLIVFSNEFFDCFPIRQFFKKNQWYEQFIKYNSAQKIFHFEAEQINDPKFLEILAKYNNVKIAEISNSRRDYFDKICRSIKNNRGVFLTIDYGYKTLPKNFSLQTIHKHKKTHLFENLGNQDITAHVDFDELIKVANDNNLKLELFSNQREFLLGYGLKERKKQLQKNKDQTVSKKIELDYERLVDKSQMGDIFKVLITSCL